MKSNSGKGNLKRMRIFYEDEADDLRIENAEEESDGYKPPTSTYNDYKRKVIDFEFDVEDYLGRD